MLFEERPKTADFHSSGNCVQHLYAYLASYCKWKMLITICREVRTLYFISLCIVFGIQYSVLVKSKVFLFHIMGLLTDFNRFPYYLAFVGTNNFTILFTFFENLFYKQNRFHSLMTKAGRVRAKEYFASIRFINDVKNMEWKYFSFITKL